MNTRDKLIARINVGFGLALILINGLFFGVPLFTIEGIFFVAFGLWILPWCVAKLDSTTSASPRLGGEEPSRLDVACAWLVMFFVMLLSFVLLLGERLKQRFFGAWRQPSKVGEDQSERVAAAASPERRRECDCCGETWEESFFCSTCSRIATDERHGDEEHGGYAMDVCGNCCQCHLRDRGQLAIQNCQPNVADAEAEDVPF